MPQRLTFEYNPLSYAYPDDESDKQLFLQASSTLASHYRIVLLYWVNMVFADGEEVWQVVRLIRRDAEDIRHAHHHHAPAPAPAPAHSPSNPSHSPSIGTTSSRRDNRFKYVYPDMIVVDGAEREHNATFPLGVLTRDQREAVLECAEDVAYDARSDNEGQCAVWMSDLLERMIAEGLVTRPDVEAIRDAVSLPFPSPSSSSSLGLSD